MMKKLLALLFAIFTIPFAYADNAAKIHIRISGAAESNRYFLCVSNVGCLSILAGDEGKIYPFYTNPTMGIIFITDLEQRERVMPQATPSSCKVTVKSGQTLTIYGNLTQDTGGYVRINGLHCTLN